jgi:predicted RNA-binding protein with PIN domain
MKYLLDGYNILFREKDSSGSLEEQRIRLFMKLNLLADASHQNLIVVLDAHRQAGESERHHFHVLEVIYTDFDQTADEYILEYVEQLSLSKRQRMKVVTSDTMLMQKVRIERIEVLSVPSFFKELQRKARVRLQKTIEPSLPKLRPKAKKIQTPQQLDNTSWTALFEIQAKQMDETIH